MAITQLSAFLENTPGTLYKAITAISGAGINIRALSITADGTVFNASITVQIDTTATLDKVIQAIGKVKGVRNVSRVS